MGFKPYLLLLLTLTAFTGHHGLHAGTPLDRNRLEQKEERLTSTINELKSKTMQWKKQYRSLNTRVNDQDNIALGLSLERPWIPSVMLMDIDELTATIDQALTLTWGDKIARGDWHNIPALQDYIARNRKRLIAEYTQRSDLMKKQANSALNKYRNRIVHINEAIRNLETQRDNLRKQLNVGRTGAGIGGIRKIVIAEYEPDPKNSKVIKNSWKGNFVRVGTENKFTATWTGTSFTGSHTEEGLSITTYIPKEKIIIKRPKLGNYTGTYHNGVWKGSADWYGAGWRWEASIHSAE